MEKTDKFSKIPSSYDILEYNFILTYLYSNFDSSFTSGKRYLVYHSIGGGHLSRLLPRSQVHDCIKLAKECSELDYEYCASI
jgi:hypothetical protein